MSFRNTFFAFCFLGTTFLPFQRLQAQDKPASGVWSLRACIDYAKTNNITIQQNAIQTEVSENTLFQSRLSRLPSVNAGASQTIAWGRSVDPFTNAFVTQRVSSNNFSLNANVTIFNGFQIRNNIQRNSKEVAINKLNTQQSENTIALNVALAYLAIMQNQELVVVAEKNLLSTQNQLERTQKLFEAGSIPEADVINLRATLANNEATLVNAQNQITLSKVNLQQQMNLPIEAGFEVEKISVENITVEKISDSPQSIYTIAEQSQPNIKSADLTIESRTTSIEIAKAGRYPTLTANATVLSGYSSASSRFNAVPIQYTQTVGYVNNDRNQPVITTVNDFIRTPTSYAFKDQVQDNFRQQIGFNLNIPIFNAGQVKTNIANAVLNKKTAEVQAKNVRNQLRQTIEQAYIDALTTYNTYQARQKQVEAQELAFNVLEKRYQAGASNLVDLNVSRNTRDNARVELIRAKYDYVFRKKVLDFYQNKPIAD